MNCCLGCRFRNSSIPGYFCGWTGEARPSSSFHYPMERLTKPNAWIVQHPKVCIARCSQGRPQAAQTHMRPQCRACPRQWRKNDRADHQLNRAAQCFENRYEAALRVDPQAARPFGFVPRSRKLGTYVRVICLP